MKALILAGGAGTRLWPVSREKKPKQFHAFVGSRTLLQMTYDRLDFLSVDDIFVSTSAAYAPEIKRQLPRLPKSHLFIEPESRDTGPAIAYAAHKLSQKLGSRKSHEAMAIIYADHIIQRKAELREKLLIAQQIAQKDHTLNIIEVKAQFPNPSLGYVKIGKRLKELADGTEIYELEKFVEKPDLETAKKYMLSYKYLWNTGIYVWKISTILEKFRMHAPKIYDVVVGGKGSYKACPKISIDYCLMEKVNPKDVRIIPADLGWSDIGNWSSVFDELTASEESNFIQGEHVGLDTEGSVIFGEKGKLIITSGIKNLVIIDTHDALLVMPKHRASEMKKIVEELKKRKKEKFL